MMNMKSSLKLLSLILALACVLIFAVSCTDNGEDTAQGEDMAVSETDSGTGSEESKPSSPSGSSTPSTPSGGDGEGNVDREYSSRYPSNSFVDFSQN